MPASLTAACTHRVFGLLASKLIPMLTSLHWLNGQPVKFLKQTYFAVGSKWPLLPYPVTEKRLNDGVLDASAFSHSTAKPRSGQSLWLHLKLSCTHIPPSLHHSPTAP